MSSRLILLSVKPEFVEKILDGEKTVEFRKQRFAASGDVMVLYATSPVKSIRGVCRIAGVDMGTPGEMWEQFNDVGGIEREPYDEYYDGKDRAVVYHLEEVQELESDLPLSCVSEGLKAPQSYRNLSFSDYRRILTMGGANGTSSKN